MVINCKSQVSPYIQRDGIVNTYLNDMRKYPLLSKDEQKKLLKNTKSSNKLVRESAIEKLINCNQRFVLSAAMKMTDGNDLLDLVNEGNIGLMTAIEKFDINKNVAFITYAVYWVQKSITEYLNQYRNMVNPPNIHKLRAKMTKAKTEFMKKNERMPTNEELQEILREEHGINVQIGDLDTFQSISVDESSSCEEDEWSVSNVKYMKATASNNINDTIKHSDDKIIVDRLLNKLNSRDRGIITKAFGIGCLESTQESIAEEYNLSKERIRQKIDEILKKLKKLSNIEGIFEN